MSIFVLFYKQYQMLIKLFFEVNIKIWALKHFFSKVTVNPSNTIGAWTLVTPTDGRFRLTARKRTGREWRINFKDRL